MILIVDQVQKKIEDNWIINNISFKLGEKEIVALVGPNGAGKTTLFNLIGGLLRPDKGKISILDKNFSKSREDILQEFVFIQDSNVFYHFLSGYEHLVFVSDIRNKSKSEIDSVIQQLGLESYIHKKVRSYSLGMKQHLVIAISILCNPKLLILDEPLNGLDPSSTDSLRKNLKHLRDCGTTILYSSHILSEVDKVADRILFIDKGKIIEEKNLSLISNETVYKVIIENYKAINESIHNLKFEFVKVDEIRGEFHVSLKQNEFNLLLNSLSEINAHVNDIIKLTSQTETTYKRIYGDNNV